MNDDTKDFLLFSVFLLCAGLLFSVVVLIHGQKSMRADVREIKQQHSCEQISLQVMYFDAENKAKSMLVEIDPQTNYEEIFDRDVRVTSVKVWN